MSSTILLKRSNATGRIPALSSLEVGELAVNTSDSKLFLRSAINSISQFIDKDNTINCINSAISSIDTIYDSLTVLGNIQTTQGIEVVSVNNEEETTTIFVERSAVGINTENPNEALTVIGSISSTGTFFASGAEIGTGSTTLFVGNSEIGINTENPTTALDINGSKIRIRQSNIPSSSSAAGNAGEICWGSMHMYVCIAQNTWKRIAYAADGEW